jgi:hypothetical protein
VCVCAWVCAWVWDEVVHVDAGAYVELPSPSSIRDFPVLTHSVGCGAVLGVLVPVGASSVVPAITIHSLKCVVWGEGGSGQVCGQVGAREDGAALSFLAHTLVHPRDRVLRLHLPHHTRCTPPRGHTLTRTHTHLCSCLASNSSAEVYASRSSLKWRGACGRHSARTPVAEPPEKPRQDELIGEEASKGGEGFERLCHLKCRGVPCVFSPTHTCTRTLNNFESTLLVLCAPSS